MGKRWYKDIARKVLPALFYKIKRWRASRSFRVAHNGSEFRAVQSLAPQNHRVVLAGPFAGMHYGDDVNCGAYVAKLVGSYEEELCESVSDIVSRQYARVIDVGAAEGYYAVGFAMCLPAAGVYAYDTDVHAQRYCRDLAKLNGVQNRVRVRGFCDTTELCSLVGPESVIICDCEGYELDLLDPAAVPLLLETDILVELHEAIRPGVTATILERFRHTHEIQLIDSRDRDPAQYPQLAVVAEADRPWAVREGRPWPMQWAWMKRRASHSPQG